MSTAQYTPKSTWQVYPAYTDNTLSFPVGYREILTKSVSSIPITVHGKDLADDVALALNNLHFPLYKIPSALSPVGQLFYQFIRRKLDQNGNSRNTVVLYTFGPSGFEKLGVENRVQSMGALQAAKEIASRYFEIPIKMVETNVTFTEFPS